MDSKLWKLWGNNKIILVCYAGVIIVLLILFAFILFEIRLEPKRKALNTLGFAETLNCKVVGFETFQDRFNPGIVFYKYRNLRLPENIDEISGWHPLPMDEEVERFVYGGKILVLGEQMYGNCIPYVENGYWFFMDRGNPKAHYTAEEMIAMQQEKKQNYIIGVWDKDEKVLYYVGYDL